MSSIFKLSIQGVRSYDERTSIQFSTPLTLIVGQNGTGKTTIIECLRYATTGDLPPNSKGGAFIHDPKLSGEREVLGQIKLAFINVNGKEMVCTRSMQLLAKKTAMQFKTLDGNLVVADRTTGMRESVGTKCADLDALMPTYLGASRSILDYVIFCHQEDSLWPLAEPSVVKRRFDEIFEATKFTKMLEDIKTMKKDIAIDIKLQKQTTSHLKVDAERASKARARLRELQDEAISYKDEADQLKIEMDEVTVESKRLFETNQRFQEVIYRLENLRDKRNVNEQTMHKLSSSVESSDPKLLNMPDEDLQHDIANFESKTLERRNILYSLQESFQQKRKELDEIRRLFNQQTLKEGQLKAEFQAYEEAQEKRSEYVSKVQGEYLEYPAIASCPATDFTALQEALNKISTELESARDKEKLKFQQEENEVQKKIQDLSTERLRALQGKLNQTEKMKNDQSEIDKLQDHIDDIHVDEGVLQYDKAELEQLEGSLSALGSKISKLEGENEFESKNEQLRKLEDDMDLQNSLLEQSSRHANEHARFEVLRNDFAKKRSALDALLDANREGFKDILGLETIDPESLEEKVRGVVSDFQKSVDRGQLDLTSKSNQVSELQALLNQVEEDLSNKKKESIRLEEELKSTMPDFSVSSFQEDLKVMEESLNAATKTMEQSVFTNDYYRTAIEIALKPEGGHKCLLCQRKFDDEADIKRFTDYLENFIETKLAITPEEARQQQKEIREDLETLRTLSPKVTRLAELNDREIAVVSGRVEEYETSLKSAKDNVDTARDELEDEKRKQDDAGRLRRVAGDIARLYREVSSLQGQVDKENTLGSSQGFEKLVPSEIHQKLGEITRKMRTLKAEIQVLSEQKNTLRIDQSNLQVRINAKKLEIIQKENQLTEKQRKKQIIKDLRESTEHAKLKLKTFSDNATEFQSLLEVEEKLLNELRYNAAEDYQKVNVQISELSNVASKLSELSLSINNYQEKNGKEQLSVCRQLVQSYATDISYTEKALDSIDENIKFEEKALLDITGRERALKDSRELHKLQTEHKELLRLISDLEAQNAERDKAKYEEESKRLQVKQGRLNSTFSSRMGELKQMEDQVERLKLELETDYKNIDEELRGAGCQLDVQQTTDGDLVGWGRAVDRAMMAFHRVNMERINEIIATLWTDAYTGTDVETILIRADSEKAGGTGRAAYNYRVTMVKQGVELDMRGRCSAGQKVLACIVIRLALAQCFGTRCGVVSLDEPTTNLDAENVAALAGSLANIIKSRIVQQNFQLVIITHDEHFLRQMHASDYIDHFFRVTRDQHQASKIGLHHISQITVD